MRHQDLTINHRLESWVYPNAAARTGATGFVSGDVGRVAYQTDTKEYWRLASTTPTWDLIGIQVITLTGDVTGSGTGSIAATVTPVTGTGNFVKSASPTFTGTVTAATVDPNNITGTSTNDNAAAGAVGETIASVIPFGSAVSVTTAVVKDITSIILTAGDWDVRGSVDFYINAAASSNSVFTQVADINNVSATIGGDGRQANSVVTSPSTTGISQVMSCALPPRRWSLGATTTLYLAGKATFPGGAVTAYGYIEARRMR